MAQTIDVANVTAKLNKEIREFMVAGATYYEAIRSVGNIYSRLLADHVAYDYSVNERWIERYKVIDEMETHVRRVM